jgi:hypothetical protein
MRGTWQTTDSGSGLGAVALVVLGARARVKLAGPVLAAAVVLHMVLILAALIVGLVLQRHFVILRCGGDGRCAATAR